MSAVLQGAQQVAPIEERPSQAPTRHLRVVDGVTRRRRPRAMYAVAAFVGAALIVLAQLGLSIATTQTTYRVSELSAQERSLNEQGQAVYEQIAGLSSPQYLASNAAAMGMIIADSPSFLRLSDGAVIGTGAADGKNTIDVGRAQQVRNALIADTPLVANPNLSIDGQAVQKPLVTDKEQAAIDRAEKAASSDAQALPVPHTR